MCDYDGFHSFSLVIHPDDVCAASAFAEKQSKMFVTLYTPIQRALDGLDVWYQNRLNWAVRHRLTVMIGCAAFFVASLFCAKYIGTEFFPAADNSRIGINLQLPIGARVERAEALASELTNKWMTRYGDMMKVCNYTVGQADSDNTFASMQDNGSHIISFNISLVSPGDRDVTLETVCDEMREDLKGYPELDKAQVILGGSTGGMSAQASADFEVYGYDFTATDKVSAELKEKLLQVKGVSEVNISRQDYQPEYQVDFDREKLALHGLNLSTASNYLRNRVMVLWHLIIAKMVTSTTSVCVTLPNSVQRLKIWRTSLFIRLPVRVSA